MMNTDIVMCAFKYTGVNTDQFVCTDRYVGTVNSHNEPPLDTKDDVSDVTTLATYNDPTKKASLSATFWRFINTKDLTQDYELVNGKTFDAIWAHGQIISNVLQSHTNSI
jgi:hypothetical protein